MIYYIIKVHLRTFAMDPSSFHIPMSILVSKNTAFVSVCIILVKHTKWKNLDIKWYMCMIYIVMKCLE